MVKHQDIYSYTLHRSPQNISNLAMCVFVRGRELCLPTSVRWEEYCFPRRQLIFSMSYIIRKVFESAFPNRFRLSVRLSVPDLQTNSGILFLSEIFDVIHQWICLNELYKLMEISN